MLAPFTPYAPHTWTKEDLDSLEDLENKIETTIFGEAINRCECSPDSMFIYDPSCKLKGNKYEFRTFFEGTCIIYDNIPEKRVVVATVYNEFVGSLFEQGLGFQFIAAPGTDNQERYKVKSQGVLQRYSQKFDGKFTPINVGIELYWESPCLHLLVDSNCAKTFVTEKGEYFGKANVASMSKAKLDTVKRIFDALVRLDQETLEKTGAALGFCLMCGKELTDAYSIKRGIGPTCLNKLNASLAL